MAKKRLHPALGAVLSLALGGRAFALGTASYSSELISARSLGQGGTGVAGTQNDPVAAYTNPAGMTSMAGTQVTGGLAYVNARPTFTNAVKSSGFGTSAYSRGNPGEVSGARATSVLVPDFGATTRLLDGRLAAGLTLVSAYGLETHFDGDSPVRYQSTDSRLRIIDLTPSVAYKICDGFSAGAGLDYFNAIEGQLDKAVNVNALNASLGGAGGPDGFSRLNGNGDGWGYHLGATIRPGERHQIGLVYHSAVKIGLSGDVELSGLSGNSAAVFGGSSFKTSVTAPLYIPQNVQLGYAFMPDEKWMLEADAAWYDWYAARQLGVVYSGLTPAQNAVLQNGNPTKFNPRKTLNFGLGANYKSGEKLQIRGGAYYQAAALPESAFDSAFVDLPRYALTAGAGYALSPALGLDVAYNAVFFHGRAIDAPGAAGSGSGYSGAFNSFAHIVSASLTWRTAAHL